MPRSREEPVHIGILTRPVDQGTSGSGSHLRQLVETLIDLNETFEITLIHHRERNDALYERANEFVVSRNPLTASIQLARQDFDLLHYAPLTILSPLWVPGVQRVATLHGAEPQQIPRHYDLPTRLHDRYAIPWLARRMDRIFTVSQTSKRFFVENYSLDPGDIILTPNAVSEIFSPYDEEKRESARKQVEETFGLQPPFLLHVSRFSERKNPWTMLKAFEQVASDREDLGFVFAGAGWDNPRIRGWADEHDLQGQLYLPGFVDRHSLPNLFNLAEAFVFPSLAEGFGMPNLEAMACGCPVVTSNRGAIPEIVDDAALILDDPQDAEELASLLRSVVCEGDLADELTQRGLKRAEEFSWNVSAKRVLSAYAKLVG